METYDSLLRSALSVIPIMLVLIPGQTFQLPQERMGLEVDVQGHPSEVSLSRNTSMEAFPVDMMYHSLGVGDN
ncbi:hypothetical protein F4802DRAFT_439237 [Xylaria palmicola]|nr:hypothetical protein F4802DRAFT_439237 [Xylaria palmicola]